jgi:predicted homoserine dehydrogenase-like protein
VIRAEQLLPVGLALDCTIARPVAKDQPLTFADVTVPPGRLIDRLYAEQEQVFAPAAAHQKVPA